MKIKLSRRKATTLIELLVVLVMMSLFIMMVFNIFSVTFDAYTFNREMAAKMYAQTNVDNFFEIFERELMYSGSMGQVIGNLDGGEFKENSILIDDATITVQYALAEQLILTKKDKANYISNIIDYDPLVSSIDLTYFPLYPAGIPSELTNRWALTYDDINDTNSATVIDISLITKTDVEVETSEGDKTATMFEITGPGITNPATYVSILLHEKAFDSLDIKEILLQSGDTKKWSGEMIYKTIIFQDASDLKITKYIPTVNSSYTLTLLNDVHDFEAAALTGQDLYIATVTYIVPDIKSGTITVTRKFLNR